MAGQLVIEDLLGRIDSDSEFATALGHDTFAALEDAGFGEWARVVEQERDRVAEVVDRIYEDAGFRNDVEADPLGTLGEWGLPEDAVEPLLLLVGAPDDVIDRATADVEAHLGKKPATVAAMTAILGALAFGQQASAASPAALTQAKPVTKAQVAKPGARAEVARPGAKAEVAKPGAKAEVSKPGAKAEVSRPGTLAQVSPVFKAQIRPEFESQALVGVRSAWHNAAKPDALWQSKLLSVLKAQGLAR